MTPKFARAVDPVFTYMLDLLERIDNTVELDPVKEKTRLMERIDTAGSVLGHAEEWTELARYAIVAWIDSELTTIRSWEGREWWLHHSLELEYWRQGLANVEFYRRAQVAAQLPSKDALEVFYVCVVLGFRGFYENAPEVDKLAYIENLGLPQDLRTWTSQQSHAIRLARKSPEISDARQQADVAPPRYGKQTLMGTALLLAVVASVAVGVGFVIFFSG
jgi:type VI secretion system protein ImpK